MAATLFLDGGKIRSEIEIHYAVEEQLRPRFYGRNLDALDEILALEVKPPITVTWINAAKSQDLLGGRFEKFVSVFRDAQARYSPDDYRFDLVM